MNHETFTSQTSPEEGGPPLPPSPENVEEDREIVEQAQELPKLRRSQRILNRENKLKELEAQSSSTVSAATSKRGKLHRPRRTLYAEHTVNCRKCGTATIFFPARTKFFSCAEIDGRLFKVKRIAAKKVLGGAYRKEPKKRPASSKFER
ncbi:uncharacterized protein LOC6530198 [Drosophila yakuba]|uniref:Uncharacterized protein n=1 Tax=Drosophila yakuba TaxID=7245 RepID=B4P5Q1_DROYA|nr:uncharacterized protein LOC6530198 [Drosophila yakuba]EDW90848.1 uncharacterized protein Dyak_GE13479 [Drosophila yakuba]